MGSAYLEAHDEQNPKKASIGLPSKKIRSSPGTRQDPAQFTPLREEAAITWVVGILLEMHHTRLAKAQGP